ncbi:MAG: UDP-2,3-diacylglucosamine diphosphatase LpxI, partial [Phycisphaeraceae bacterium]
MDDPIGLIAGGGRLPVLVAEGMRAQGHRVVCISLAGNHDPQLVPLCDRLKSVGLTRLGSWIRHLRRFGAKQAVMVGYVRKTSMYDPCRYLKHIPDLRTLRLWFKHKRQDMRTNTMLVALAGELDASGVRLIDGAQFFKQHMATHGNLTTHRPADAQMKEIEHGWRYHQILSDLDISQAIAVSGRRILAIEAIEGTDALIRRAGTLCQGQAWTLIKATKPNQDLRLDLPVIGTQTILNMKEAGGMCLAIEVGKVIMVDKPLIIEAANASG